jgi:hypothetical protein
MITVRTLPADEWPRLAYREPFATSGLPLDDGHTLIQVAEDDGTIIGHTILQDAVHWHFDVDQEHQGNPAVFGGLIKAGIVELQAGGVPHVHATIADSLPMVQHMAERLGFVPSHATLYILSVPVKD